MVVANISSILFDQEFWGDPSEFRPEIFIKDRKLNVPDRFLPFGFGKKCLIFNK